MAYGISASAYRMYVHMYRASFCLYQLSHTYINHISLYYTLYYLILYFLIL